jgi:uncharacterized protein (DUF433 family)
VNLKELVESRIVRDEEIAQGKPRIKGTRVAVVDILLSLAEGLNTQDILRNYRALQERDIQAALAYAYCLTENIKPKILSSFDEKLLDSATTNTVEDENQKFSEALAMQASIQEEITRERVAEIKANKEHKTKIPVQAAKQPPQVRPYDLLIDISDESTKIYLASEHLEQGIDMSVDNYIFELRPDLKPWLAYSTKEGIEIDQGMKRNLLVTYKAIDGSIRKSVFEGYLTTDRKHKIFMQKNSHGEAAGKVL